MEKLLDDNFKEGKILYLCDVYIDIVVSQLACNSEFHKLSNKTGKIALGFMKLYLA